MVVGWGILIPIGMIAARYFKIWPGQDWPRELDNRTWWNAHRALQIVGLGVTTVGLYLAWKYAGGQGALAKQHAVIGWSVMVLGWSQFAGGLLRGTKGGPTDPRRNMGDLSGDHYFMTPRRRVFEFTHKLAGYLAISAAATNIVTGLLLSDAPRWMWLLIGAWWLAVVAATIHFQRSGMCVDTYQAIWGPDQSLPGNQRRPIGVGVRRLPANGDSRQ